MYPNLGSQYNFLKRVGIGGTGVVNLAIDTHSGFPVAIKSLHASIMDTNPEMSQKLRIEANIYLMLTHPNIVKLKNFIVNETAHLVMDYIEGKPLDEYISQVTGPIPSEVAIAMLKEIVSAIGYAHNKRISIPGYDGVLHLDIKPSNVLISNSGNVKLIDYGISQGSSEERKEKMYTAMYAAPEQFDLSEKLDYRTDIYSIGVLLHQMITGKTPYPKEMQHDEVMKLKTNGEPLDRIIDIYPAADIRLQEIIDVCTARDPNHRYQDCDELLTDLNEL